MKQVLNVKRLVVGALLCGLISATVYETAGATSFPRDKTIYLGGSQWGDPTTFNPLAEIWQGAWPVRDRFNLMYEPLLAYNTINGKFEPNLGTLVSKGADSIVVDINPEAKWSDGTQVTGKDVKFVFEIGRRFPGAATAYAAKYITGIQVRNVTTNGLPTERCVFMVDKKGYNNPLVILDHLVSIRIIPSHVFEKLLTEKNNDLAEVQKLKMDVNPVVSGPYTLDSYSNEKIVLKRRDDYWGNKALFSGKKPVPEFIIHPILKSNDAFAIALQQGQLDASQTFIPRIWLKKKNGVGTWHKEAPYFTSGVIPMLLINVNSTPLNDKNFRRAMAAAINYSQLKEFAISGYSPEVQPGLIMPTSLERKYLNTDDTKQYGVSYNPALAKKILADGGYKSVYKADGSLDYMIDNTGKKMPTLTIKVPAGWSDWEAMVELSEKGMRAVGIDVRKEAIDASLYWANLASGDFKLIMHKPAANVSPSLPWNRFYSIMSTANWGTTMNENQGRYNNPKDSNYKKVIDDLINSIPSMTDETKIIAAYRELNKIFMEDQPAIPLSYLPEQFYEFSSGTWKNWPTEDNPYAPALLPMMGASTKALWQLKLTKVK